MKKKNVSLARSVQDLEGVGHRAGDVGGVNQKVQVVRGVC